MNHTLSIDRCAWASCLRWWWGDLQVLLKLRVSRRASLLSFSVSMVKRMEGRWLFKCSKKTSTFLRSRMVKGIVHVAFPDPTLVGWCSYRLFFEILHVEVDNDSGNRIPHGGAVFLLVNRSVILKVCESQYEGQKVLKVFFLWRLFMLHHRR